MIDKKMGEKQLQIEVSCGNAGNSIDGQLASASKTSGNDTDSIASGNYDDGGKLFLHYKGQCFMAKCGQTPMAKCGQILMAKCLGSQFNCLRLSNIPSRSKLVSGA